MADVKATVYLRQSADRTGEELGITRQREDARRLAEMRGWEIVSEHTDNDISAAGKKHRPGFEKVLEAMTAGTTDVVIAWDMTRLSRNSRDRLRLLEAGKASGITLAFVRGSDVDLGTPAGRLTADILGSVAQHEIEQKGDRQRRAYAQAAADGRRVGGRRPFGYEADGITIRAAEAAALRKAFEGILAGRSLRAISAEMNAAGFVTPQPRRDGSPSPWTGQALGPVLKNPRYAGLRAVGIGHGQTKEWVNPVPAVWPGIVPEETWRAVNAVLTDPTRRRRSLPRSGKRLLTGLALCGVCGATVHAGGSPKRGGTGHRLYRCSASTGHVVRKSEPVDDWVTKVIVRRLSRPDAAQLLVKQDRPDIAALTEEARAIRIRLDALAEDYADGVLDRDAFRSGTARGRERLAAVEAQMADAGRVDVLGPLVGVEDVQAVWDRLDVERRQAVIDTLAVIRLLPVGRGTRTFREETVVIEPKE